VGSGSNMVVVTFWGNGNPSVAVVGLSWSWSVRVALASDRCRCCARALRKNPKLSKYRIYFRIDSLTLKRLYHFGRRQHRVVRNDVSIGKKQETIYPF
jgi:hypothetical protein